MFKNEKKKIAYYLKSQAQFFCPPDELVSNQQVSIALVYWAVSSLKNKSQ